jgi:hypothetical protein
MTTVIEEKKKKHGTRSATRQPHLIRTATGRQQHQTPPEHRQNTPQQPNKVHAAYSQHTSSTITPTPFTHSPVYHSLNILLHTALPYHIHTGFIP